MKHFDIHVAEECCIRTIYLRMINITKYNTLVTFVVTFKINTI